MHYVADLHLHSRYSRAVSKDMVLPIMSEYAKWKGLDILSACDFTHPLWFKEIRAQLEEKSQGLFQLKSQNSEPQKEPHFLLSTEISCIYSQDGKLRRVHNLVFVPSFETAEKIIKELQKRGCNLMADGRPIIGMPSKTLLQIVLEIDSRAMLIPCHIWTPHFGIYGSASGFDSLQQAFGDLANQIYGIETGLSSDPEMNWEVPELMNRSILSFSDAHSPAKMGREATVFDLEESTYENIRRAIMRKPVIASETKQSLDGIAASPTASRNDNRIVYTIEFYPEEGKYHFSGHRNCKVVRGPEEIRRDGDTCLVCKKKLTDGVLFRVQQLASEDLLNRVEEKTSPHGIKWYTDKQHNQPPYVKLVPLLEIVAESVGTSTFSMKTRQLYDRLCIVPSTRIGSELDILLKIPIDTIRECAGDIVADGVKRVRGGDITINPGYDGEYGKVEIWPRDEVSKVPEVSKVSKGEPDKAAGEAQLGLEI